jgi:hypothetical protein
MIYEYQVNGLMVQTGDLICTTDGGSADIKGQFWWLVGKLIPGDVDHIVIYVGPGGRCIEAGARGMVIAFDMTGGIWDSEKMAGQRGMLIDEIYGIAYPLEGKTLEEAQSARIRENIANYCRQQIGKPYNLNFLDSSTEAAFYCSQLAYKAYIKEGIDLNTRIGIPDIPGTETIIFPQKIWSGCVHRRAVSAAKLPPSG